LSGVPGVKENLTMKTALVRIAITIAFALSIVTPMTASADTLSPTMMTALTNGTKAYFKALGALDYATLQKMTTPGFQIIKDGKPIGSKLAAQIQTAKLQLHNVSGSVKVNSATQTGDTVVSDVSLAASGQSMGAGSENTATNHTLDQKHTLTWVKAASGKWLLAKDVVTSSKTGSM
jgi:hypothetical protein